MERQREFARLNYTETYRAKMVDSYFPSGKKHREVFFVKKQFKGGQCVRVWAETEKRCGRAFAAFVGAAHLAPRRHLWCFPRRLR